MKKTYLFSVVLLSFAIANPLLSKVVQSIGGGPGVCLPQGGWNPGFSIIAQANMGEVLKYLYFSPYIKFSQAGKSEEINQELENLSVQYLTFGTKLVGYINTKPKGFYLGGAVSFNLIASDEIEWGEFAQNTRINTNNTTKLGFSGLAGYLFMLKTLSIFIETGYMVTVGGNNNLTLLTGLNLTL
jgi:hypothetical protein